MKKQIFLFLLSFLLVSCSITEKMIVKENLEAQFRFGFDMSPLLKMDNKSKKEKKEYKKIDSTFTFAQLFQNMPKDSVEKYTKGDSKKLELLNAMSCSFKVDEANNIFSYEIGLTIPNINQNESVPQSDAIGNLLLLSDKKYGNVASLTDKSKEEKNAEAKYFYNGKMFSKTTVNKNPAAINSLPIKKSKKKSKKDEFAQFGEKVDEVLKECKYKMEYQFPKAIKTVSLKGAVLAVDKKSFVYEIPFEQYDTNKNLDFEVVFE